MSKSYNLQEVRVRYPGSTATDTFTALNDATWADGGGSPATKKLQHVNKVVDVSSLEYMRLDNPEVRTRMRGMGRGILGQRKGTFTVSFYLNSTAASDDVLDLLEVIFGGRHTPTQDSVALDASGTHTGSVLYAAGIESMLVPGCALLCGVRGDGRGNGEVIPVASESTNSVVLARATKSTMQDGDTVWISHSVYPDEDATQSYLQFALIGKDESGPSQINCVNCMATKVTFENLSHEAGQLPIVTLEISVGDWRHEPAATKTSLSHATAPAGPLPAMDRSIGGFWFTLTGSAQVRGYMLGGEVSVDPGIAYVPLSDPSMANAIGGWSKVKGNAKYSIKAYTDRGSPKTPFPDLAPTDFASDTHAFQVLAQYGHAADKCMAIDMPKTYLDKEPMETELNQLLAAMIEGHADETYTASNDLKSADIKIHFFHT